MCFMNRNKKYVRGRQRKKSYKKKVRYLSFEGYKPKFNFGNSAKYVCVELELVDRFYKKKSSNYGAIIASKLQIVKDKKNVLEQLRHIVKTQTYDI